MRRTSRCEKSRPGQENQSRYTTARNPTSESATHVGAHPPPPVSRGVQERAPPLRDEGEDEEDDDGSQAGRPPDEARRTRSQQ